MNCIKKLLFAGLLYCSSSYAFSQQIHATVVMEHPRAKPGSDTIYYDPNRLLTWKDFQGNPDYSLPAAAVTASGFAYTAEMTSVDDQWSLSIGIYTYFDKHRSWKKPGHLDAYHLLHEQNHFNITRLSAEKLLIALQKARFSKEACNREINAVFDKVYKEHLELQKQYDLETRNSLDVKKQVEWNERIADAMKKLFSE